ncbi:MAG: transglycosylase SLT domain-containing protein [Microbacteriaceae bacterium]|nr:transglycosylase SLT domain-containing protein [Microbacteriaceae bacterium]
MTSVAKFKPFKRSRDLLRTVLAGVCAVAVGAVVVAAPLSVPTASADYAPLALGERMNQTLMTQATEQAAFALQTISIEKKPEPEKKVESGSTSGSGSAASASFSAPSAPAPSAGSAQAIALRYVGAGPEFNCLVALWNKESNWNAHAMNASSGAYGIPQSLPGSKMASAGADWQTNPETQIRWGLGYIKGRYGSPCAAWGHSQRVGWY